LQNRFVLAFRIPNQRSMKSRIPKVTCLHLRPRHLKPSGYHRPLPTRVRASLLQASSTLLRKTSASRRSYRRLFKRGPRWPSYLRAPGCKAATPLQLKPGLIYGHGFLIRLPSGQKTPVSSPPPDGFMAHPVPEVFQHTPNPPEG